MTSCTIPLYSIGHQWFRGIFRTVREGVNQPSLGNAQSSLQAYAVACAPDRVADGRIAENWHIEDNLT
jgi:hypothetical protein